MIPITSEYIVCGYSCNNNCIYCCNKDIIAHLKSNKTDFSTQEIKAILNDVKKKNIKQIIISGGEPTIRKDFFELLEFAKVLGLTVSLQTNGRMFCLEEFSRKTVNLMRNKIWFNIHLDSLKTSMGDKITRVRGSTIQTLQGIKNLRKYTDKIYLTVILTKLNYTEVFDFINYAKSLKLRGITFKYPTITQTLKTTNLLLKYSQLKNIIFNSLKYAEKENVWIEYCEVPLCYLQGYENHYTELIESTHGINKLIKSPDGETKFKELFLSIKAKPVKCKKCKFFNMCEGIYTEYLKIFGSDEFIPVRD